MMRSSRTAACVVLWLALAWPVGAAFGQTAPASGDDVKAMVKDLVETIRLQQQSINEMKQRMDSSDKQMQELRDMVKQQTEQFKSAQESIQQTQKQIEEAGPAGGEGSYRATDEYSAELQFKNAYSVQHLATFDEHIKRKDQPPYFRQAIKEYTVVVDRYPKTRWADESLVRIARLYKKLGENGPAKAAYERLLKEYPESEYQEEAQQQIAELGR